MAFGQSLDSSYWRGWYKTPGHVLDISQWEERGWWTAAGITAVGVGIYAFDEEIEEAFVGLRTPATAEFSHYVAEPIGSGLYSLGGSAVLWTVGLVTEDQRLQRTSAQAFKAFVLTGGATVMLKQLTHRARPNESSLSIEWFGPYAITGDNDAFPSGHTSTAFAVASVFAHSYSDRPWVGITAYSLASLAGLSRIHDQAHWASDVFFGAALGWYVGRVIVKNDGFLQVVPTGNGVLVRVDLER